MDQFYLDKFRGALIGMAIGNIIGNPFKGRLKNEISLHYDYFFEFIKKHRDQFHSIGSDTQLAIHTTKALIEAKGYSSDLMIKHLIDWLDDPPINPGYNSLTTIKKLKYGVSLQKASSNSGGNGALTRVAPIGLFFSKDLVKLREVALASTSITHSNPFAKASAVLIARAISFLLDINSEKGFFINDFFDSLEMMISHTQKKEWDTLITILAKLKNNLNLSMEAGIIKFSQVGVKSPYFIEDYLGKAFIHPYSVSTLICALFIFLKNLNSFEKCIFELCTAGGNTDTVGALGGALAGVYFGEKQIPKELISLEDNYKTFFTLASDLLEIFQEKYLTKFPFRK